MMIEFDYEGVRCQAWQIRDDEIYPGCLFCFQVSPKVGHRSFMLTLMSRVIEIDRAPFEHLLQGMDADGFMGQKGGGLRDCVVCGSIDELNFDSKCPGCEEAMVIYSS